MLYIMYFLVGSNFFYFSRVAWITVCVLLCQICISYNLLPYNVLRHAQNLLVLGLRPQPDSSRYQTAGYYV